MPYGTNQEVQFGVNLLDVSQDLNGADICTVLIPVGETSDGNPLTISDVAMYNETDHLCPKNITGGTTAYGKYYYNDHIFLHKSVPDCGDDELFDKEAYELYGRILMQKEFPNANTTNLLMSEATKWLADKNESLPTIECSAADLHYISGEESNEAFRIGQRVKIESAPHLIRDLYLPIYKISMNLDSGTKKMSIGTPPKRELTDITKSSSGSTRSGSSQSTSSGGSSGGSGGGGGTVTIPVKDVQVKKFGDESYHSTVNKKID
mgnify:CR=1 FL=1